MGNTALTQNVVGIDEKVKAAAGDTTPGYLDAKVDGSTITVTGNQLVRAALTGGVTTVGNAATVVTNANLTGIVTSTGNATAIADAAIALAKLANGTAGNVVTYSAGGAIAVAATGTSGQILTSNGAGAAPTFQTPAGGSDLTLVSVTSGSGTNTGDITIAADNHYKVIFSFTGNPVNTSVTLAFNSDTTGTDYQYWRITRTFSGTPTVTTTGSSGAASVPVSDDINNGDQLVGAMEINTWDNLADANNFAGFKLWGEGHSNDSTELMGQYTAAAVTNFEFQFSTTTDYNVYLYRYEKT